jgi:phenylpropionate dioxygenase-like ring-hydroxylating dioxygenase large terminal subunit
MIPNQWYAVLSSKEVKRNKMIGATRLGEKLVFWREKGGALHCIAKKIRVMAAFAPTDDEHTMIYMRFYQRVLPLPLGKALMRGPGNAADRVILHQDRRVVLTQLPKKSELQMGENLVPGDAPIVQFRLKRDQLKKEATQPK